MNPPENTLPQGYFDNVYKASNDPWNFATSDYERAKYEATIAALPQKHYANAFEIGCSIGVLSEMLAVRCDALLSVDVSELPLKTARERLAKYPQVTVAQRSIPADFPAGPFSLMVLSEVGYYLSVDDLRLARTKIIANLAAGGDLVLVHWTPPVPDYPLTGDQVHDLFMVMAGPDQPLTHLQHQRAETYRLDVFRKN